MARYLALLGLLSLGWVLALVWKPAPLMAPHLPREDEVAVYEREGWRGGPLLVEAGDNPGQGAWVGVAQRGYISSDEHRQATFTLWSTDARDAKVLLRKGPDRDFLGAGYTSQAVSPDLSVVANGGGALLTSRGSDSWLLVYTLGAGGRQGLGDGPAAWGWWAQQALFATAPDQAYLARVAVAYDAEAEPPPVAHATRLAATFFPRVAAWYAQR